MEKSEINSLIAQALGGDTTALTKLAEWAEREAIAQELADAPAGLRDLALSGLDAFYEKQRHKANRSTGTAESNRRRAKAYRAEVEKVIGTINLHVKAEHQLVGIVQKKIERDIAAGRSNLKTKPDDEPVREMIRARLRPRNK